MLIPKLIFEMHFILIKVSFYYFLELNSNFPTFYLRFELRLRFISKDLEEMYQTETDAFMFLHDQILADYVTQV